MTDVHRFHFVLFMCVLAPWAHLRWGPLFLSLLLLLLLLLNSAILFQMAYLETVDSEESATAAALLLKMAIKK